MSEIISVQGREVLDSRGNPTVEAEVVLLSGASGRAIVPSGASKGEFEALELIDGGDRYGGYGKRTAVAHVDGPLAEAVEGLPAYAQGLIDQQLIDEDGTKAKEKLGANAILAVSMAVARAAAEDVGMPLYRYLGGAFANTLPVPMMNVFNGGAHSSNIVDFQEYMIVPAGAPTFAEALRWGAEIFHALKKILHERKLPTTVGDEGGFAPDVTGDPDNGIDGNEAALLLVREAVAKAGYKLGEEVFLALDVAASELYDKKLKVYRTPWSNRKGKPLTTAQMVDKLVALADKYPEILSIEDGLAQEDWAGWIELTRRIGDRVQIVGDDVFVTNTERLAEGIARKASNSILIKLNQIGTVSETVAAVRMAQAAGWTTVISHRSGETEDTFIADFAVAVGAGQIKTGSLSRTDRIAKYNQLLRIEEELGPQAHFAGLEPFQRLQRAFGSAAPAKAGSRGGRKPRAAKSGK